jgi:hypothetical protein
MLSFFSNSNKLRPYKLREPRVKFKPLNICPEPRCYFLFVERTSQLHGLGHTYVEEQQDLREGNCFFPAVLAQHSPEDTSHKYPR